MKIGSATMFVAAAAAVVSFAMLIAPSSSAGLGAGGIPPIGVYWGQGGTAEGTLKEACASGNYEYVNIGFLNKFGNAQRPQLDLSTHCHQYDGSCRRLSEDISECQKYNIKVILSIGGPNGDYGLKSSDEAKALGNYLYYNFLSNFGGIDRPLGDVALNGIDFNVDDHGIMYWDELATTLGMHRKGNQFSLSASVSCSYPDEDMKYALGTGLFDHVSIRFHDNKECEYQFNNAQKLKDAWNKWINNVNANKFSLGLLASPQSGTGYILPNDLHYRVLNYVKQDEKYGGVTIKSRLVDKDTDYSAKIAAFV